MHSEWRIICGIFLLLCCTQRVEFYAVRSIQEAMMLTGIFTPYYFETWLCEIVCLSLHNCSAPALLFVYFYRRNEREEWREQLSNIGVHPLGRLFRLVLHYWALNTIVLPHIVHISTTVPFAVLTPLIMYMFFLISFGTFLVVEDLCYFPLLLFRLPFVKGGAPQHMVSLVNE
ncbi:unnamed protein product [Trypanosoma congolense IL3000]|uniref:WGS project CAEQ00000000 data, annotated contig 7 n=1 Tax=Trypanosoma congolense (strain IL3000) TaxID=1068625 RepID=F9WI21_TRYCI|nr:unnamed protein product [Trypanosoma congolense IL3000]